MKSLCLYCTKVTGASTPSRPAAPPTARPTSPGRGSAPQLEGAAAAEGSGERLDDVVRTATKSTSPPPPPPRDARGERGGGVGGVGAAALITASAARGRWACMWWPSRTPSSSSANGLNQSLARLTAARSPRPSGYGGTSMGDEGDLRLEHRDAAAAAQLGRRRVGPLDVRLRPAVGWSAGKGRNPLVSSRKKDALPPAQHHEAIVNPS